MWRLSIRCGKADHWGKEVFSGTVLCARRHMGDQSLRTPTQRIRYDWQDGRLDHPDTHEPPKHCHLLYSPRSRFFPVVFAVVSKR